MNSNDDYINSLKRDWELMDVKQKAAIEERSRKTLIKAKEFAVDIAHVAQAQQIENEELIFGIVLFLNGFIKECISFQNKENVRKIIIEMINARN